MNDQPVVAVNLSGSLRGSKACLRLRVTLKDWPLLTVSLSREISMVR